MFLVVGLKPVTLGVRGLVVRVEVCVLLFKPHDFCRGIVELQAEFFDIGGGNLRPMTLKDVAIPLELHESTISRVTTSKWVHTPLGLFELKYFFNSSIRRETSETSEDIASESVKVAIKRLVEAEDKRKPYSDEDIVKKLREDAGIDIARRTVAKYREELRILSSTKRKKLF